jgi:hypothetical protein
MAYELDHDHQLARHRGALPLAWSRAVSLLLVIPGRRSARGRRARHAECRACFHLRDGCRRIPRAGFRHFSLRSPERWKGRSAR